MNACLSGHSKMKESFSVTKRTSPFRTTHSIPENFFIYNKKAPQMAQNVTVQLRSLHMLQAP